MLTIIHNSEPEHEETSTNQSRRIFRTRVQGKEYSRSVFFSTSHLPYCCLVLTDKLSRLQLTYAMGPFHVQLAPTFISKSHP